MVSGSFGDLLKLAIMKIGTLGDFLSYQIFRLAILPFRLGSLRWARTLGRSLGLFAYHVIPIRKRVVEKNLRHYFGQEWDEARLKAGVRDAYLGMGLAIGEFAFGEKLGPKNIEQYVRIEGLEHYEAAHRAGRSVILYGGHQAMWEWAVSFPHFLQRPFHVVMKRIHNDYLDGHIKRRRSKFGVVAISQRGAIRELKELTDADVDYGVFIDQRAARGKGVWVNVRGNPVSAMPGAAILALRGNLSVIPIRVLRAEHGMIFRFHAPLAFTPGPDFEKDVQTLTQMMNDPITEWVAERPADYFWMHDRFKIHADEQDIAANFARTTPAV